jgi:hypothetical protein
MWIIFISVYLYKFDKYIITFLQGIYIYYKKSQQVEKQENKIESGVNIIVNKVF